MKKDLLAVYNTCGISGEENISYYKKAIAGLLDQSKKNMRVVVSGCLNNKKTKQDLKNTFGNLISYSFIDERLPVNVTFNKTVQESVKNFGRFKGYLYLDSGIDLSHDNIAVEHLFYLHTNGNYGMTASRTDTDAGTFVWFNEGKHSYDESGQEKLFQKNHLVIPVGKALNLHCQIFDDSIFDNFNQKLMPDIFASHCTESTFSYLCAAIDKKFIVHKDVIAKHLTSMDGPSSGFNPELNGFPSWAHSFKMPSPETMINLIKNPEAIECGFGYEECRNVLKHNPEKYSKDGRCLDPDRLKKFINENLFLKDNYLDYNQIKCDFSL